MRKDLRVVAYLGVANHTSRPDAHAIPQLHGSFEHNVDVDEDILTVSHPAPDVDSRRICNRHPRQHQLPRGRRRHSDSSSASCTLSFTPSASIASAIPAD